MLYPTFEQIAILRSNDPSIKTIRVVQSRNSNAEHLQQTVEAIRTSTHLVSVLLRVSQALLPALVDLQRAICASPSIQEVVIETDHSVTTAMGPRLTPFLVDLCQASCCLQRLVLANVNLALFAVGLASLLVETKSLTELKLENVKSSQRDLKIVENALHRNKTLRRIVLVECEMNVVELVLRSASRHVQSCSFDCKHTALHGRVSLLSESALTTLLYDAVDLQELQVRMPSTKHLSVMSRLLRRTKCLKKLKLELHVPINSALIIDGLFSSITDLHLDLSASFALPSFLSSFSALVAGVIRNDNIETLSMESSIAPTRRVDEEVIVAALRDLLLQSTSVRTLRLKRLVQGRSSSRTLAEGMDGNTSLQHLSFEHCYRLDMSLLANVFAKIRRFKLGECRVPLQTLHSIGQAMSAPNCSCDEIDLSGANLNNECALLLAEYLRLDTVRPRVLVLNDNEFGDEGAVAILAALEGKSNLETLELTGCIFMEQPFVEKLAETLPLICGLKRLAITWRPEMEAAVLLNALKINTSLIDIVVDGSSFQHLRQIAFYQLRNRFGCVSDRYGEGSQSVWSPTLAYFAGMNREDALFTGIKSQLGAMPGTNTSLER